MIKKIRYYLRIARWFYKNQDCPNNRAKWRRLDREMKGCECNDVD